MLNTSGKRGEAAAAIRTENEPAGRAAQGLRPEMLAELSFLVRQRRMVMGQHHLVSPQYLYQFAAEAAWKEDHRRLSNGELSYKQVGLAMAHPVSRVWAGYRQRAQ